MKKSIRSKLFTRSTQLIFLSPSHLSRSRVSVLCQFSAGLPRAEILGVNRADERELLTRVGGALRSIGVRFPERRVLFSLESAQKTFNARGLALPLALSYLLARLQSKIPQKFCCVGDLEIDGRVVGIGGIASLLGFLEPDEELLAPEEDVCGLTNTAVAKILPFAHLEALLDFLQTGKRPPLPGKLGAKPLETSLLDGIPEFPGQSLAKRTLLVAAAGGHHVLLAGPPGSGKSVLAGSLHRLLPPLTDAEAEEVRHSYRDSGLVPPSGAPNRDPVSSCSRSALVGSRSSSAKGELILAHNGVLQVNELLEWQRSVLEMLRQPLEGTLPSPCLPSPFSLRLLMVATTNLCACGAYGGADVCMCAPSEQWRYRNRASRAILDRIPLRVLMGDASGASDAPSSFSLREGREKVRRARERMHARWGSINQWALQRPEFLEFPFRGEAARLMKAGLTVQNFSLRRQMQIRSLAITLADLEAMDQVSSAHVEEALFLSQDILGAGGSLRVRRQNIRKAFGAVAIH